VMLLVSELNWYQQQLNILPATEASAQSKTPAMNSLSLLRAPHH